ncbi:MAG TPA: hypothetical protein VGX28_04035 [Frankiaceae bacterium]|jgi:hypothetical protein|nr:hypothetical protein [Frankiaceae bacterium]
MRRLAAALLGALLLPLPVAHAAAPELTIVADHPSTVAVDLDAPVAIDSEHLTFTTSSRYVVITAQLGPDVEFWMAKWSDGNWMGAGTLPAGHVVLTVYTDGPMTFRTRGTGLTAPLTIAPETPVQATSESRTVVPDADGNVESDIAFTNPAARAFVLASYERSYTLRVLGTQTFCVTVSGDYCETESPPVSSGSERQVDQHVAWPYQGTAHSIYRGTGRTFDATPVLHELVVLPLA